MWTALFRVNWKLNSWGGGRVYKKLYCTFILAVFCFSFFTYFQTLFSWFSITTLVTSLSRIVPKCTQNVFDGIKINFQVGRSLLVRAAWIPLISASPLCKNEQQRLMAITWIRPHICHRYHTLYPWRKIYLVGKFQISVKNLNNLWSFIEIYAIFVTNLCGEYFCG